MDVPLKVYSSEEIAAARRDIAQVGTGKFSFLEEVDICNRADINKLGGKKLNLEVQVFRLSDDTAVVGLPRRSVRRSRARNQAALPIQNDDPHRAV